MIRAALTALVALGAASAAAAHFQYMSMISVRKTDGTLAASAVAFTTGQGVKVLIGAQELPPGTYGIHLHAVGRCEGPSFESAGPHWNPSGRQHGTLNPQGHHLGDLPNLEVDAQGRGQLEFVVPGVTLRAPRGLIDLDGAALIIHANPDDYRTDPSGNSGARIACGVLQR